MPRRMRQLVTRPWLDASGGPRLDLTRAPFRLLAIVNRMDLADLSRGSAGEGRFVFGVVGPNGEPLEFTVILEFHLPATTQADVDAWADAWHALGALPSDTEAFNAALEAITHRFARRDAAPTRPNGSAINQVRTNELALGVPWEMREFTLNASGRLVQTPPALVNETPALAQFINANTTALLDGTHQVPPTFEGQPFLGGSVFLNFRPGWGAPPVVLPEARFRFSVNTCNGCHEAETATSFVHVAPREPGKVAGLSRFLTGGEVPDLMTHGTRTFDELSVRAESLRARLCREPSSRPSVALLSPSTGETLSGASTVTASATNVTTVQFLVDGVPVAPPAPAPFSAPFDADSVQPGVHLLTAVGMTAAGTITSAPVRFVTAPSRVLPDFAARLTGVPVSALSDGVLAPAVTVCNQGTASGVATVELLLSEDPVVASPASGSGDVVVDGAELPLKAGECQALRLQGPLRLRSGVPPTALFVGVVVDGAKAVAETNEENNASGVRRL